MCVTVLSMMIVYTNVCYCIIIHLMMTVSLFDQKTVTHLPIFCLEL